MRGFIEFNNDKQFNSCVVMLNKNFLFCMVCSRLESFQQVIVELSKILQLNIRYNRNRIYFPFNVKSRRNGVSGWRWNVLPRELISRWKEKERKNTHKKRREWKPNLTNFIKTNLGIPCKLTNDENEAETKCPFPSHFLRKKNTFSCMENWRMFSVNSANMAVWLTIEKEEKKNQSLIFFLLLLRW